MNPYSYPPEILTPEVFDCRIDDARYGSRSAEAQCRAHDAAQRAEIARLTKERDKLRADGRIEYEAGKVDGRVLGIGEERRQVVWWLANRNLLKGRFQEIVLVEVGEEIERGEHAKGSTS